MRRRPKGTLAPAANWHESASCLIPWHRNAALIYSLAVETFMDGDGDGIGDFAGLTRRLDYLESLGVDALWLSPSSRRQTVTTAMTWRTTTASTHGWGRAVILPTS